MKTIVEVSGMTCDHCVQSVTKELSALPDVSEVSVELDSAGKSSVSITHSDNDMLGSIAEAIAKAGYTLEAVVSQS